MGREGPSSGFMGGTEQPSMGAARTAGHRDAGESFPGRGAIRDNGVGAESGREVFEQRRAPGADMLAALSFAMPGRSHPWCSGYTHGLRSPRGKGSPPLGRFPHVAL